MTTGPAAGTDTAAGGHPGRLRGARNHHVLAIHHVYDNDLRWLWDLSFLAVGVGLRLTRDVGPTEDAYTASRRGMSQQHA